MLASVGLLPPQPDVIGHQVEVVPRKQLPLSQAVVNHAVVAIVVLEGDGRGLPLAGFGVVHVVDDSVGGCIAGHGVQLPTDDERVGHRRLSDVGLPASLHRQGVGVQLRNHDRSLGLVGGIDGPQPLLINRQVDVCVAPPRVRELAMEASMGKFTASCDAL